MVQEAQNRCQLNWKPCVKARVEVKAVDRQNDKIIAVDRQTAVVVDLTEQIAGKSALQKAGADIAERLLPKLVTK